MSTEGPKIGGGRYGSVWNGRKIAKSDDPSGGSCRVRWPDPGESGGC